MKILVPSYGRDGTASTMDILPSALIVVPESQREQYERHYPGRVIAIPDDQDGNISKKRNAMLELLAHGEACWMVDDDLQRVHRMKDGYVQDVEQVLESFTVLAEQLGAFYGGFSNTSDPVKYAEYAPFSLCKPSYGCVYIRRDSRITYDTDLGRHEDADIYLQYMNKHRRVIRDNRYYFQFECNKDTAKKTQRGGIEHNEEHYNPALDKLIHKWGDLIKVKNGKMNGTRQPISGI